MCKQGVDSRTAVEQASRVAAFSAVNLRGSGEPRVSASSLANDPVFSVLVSATDIDIPEEASSQLAITELTPIPVGEFLVSIQVKSNFRRLHRNGSCPWRARVDFAYFELLASAEPDATTYLARCKRCFKTEQLIAQESCDSFVASSPTASE